MVKVVQQEMTLKYCIIGIVHFQGYCTLLLDLISFLPNYFYINHVISE